MADSLFRQLGSIVSNAINTEKSQRTAAIATETTARQNADTTLQTAITNEASVRQSAITALSNTISALDSAYKAADTALTTNVTKVTTDLATEVTARQTAISTLDTAYKAADTALSSVISTKLGATDKAADTTLFDGVASSGYIKYYQQAAAPTTANDGSIWKDTDNGLLYMAANDGAVLTWFAV